MALYQNGILISGANKLPQMTYAEWQALPVSERPSEWICTDRSYSDLPASDVTYDNTDSGLSADNIQDAIDEVAQSGGSGGHVIQNASGTAVAQEPTMQFTDSHVSDDSTNEKTIIENIKSVASADYSSETEDGLYLIPDGDGSVIEPASEDYIEVTADGVKTYGALFNELFAQIDLTKISAKSFINLQWSASGSDIFYLTEKTNTNILFTCAFAVNNTNITTISLKSSNSAIKSSVNGTITDNTSTVLVSGNKLTLYYGNKKAVVDLQTTANRCWYDSNTTVKQKLDGFGTVISSVENATSTTASTGIPIGCRYILVEMRYEVGGVKQVYASSFIPVLKDDTERFLVYNNANVSFTIYSNGNVTYKCSNSAVSNSYIIKLYFIK